MSKSSFGFKKPEDSPGFLLWQTTVIWQRLIKEALNPYNISHPQFVVMAVLLWFHENNHTPIQIDIIEMTKLDKMTVSKALKKLTTVALIERIENKQDTRAKSVTLTKKGYDLVKKMIPIVEGIDKDFFGKIKASERNALIGSFNKLAQG